MLAQHSCRTLTNVLRSCYRCNQTCSGSDADDERLGGKAAENSPKRQKPSNKRKKKSVEEKMLSKPVKDLSAKQRKTCKELQVSVLFDTSTVKL